MGKLAAPTTEKKAIQTYVATLNKLQKTVQHNQTAEDIKDQSAVEDLLLKMIRRNSNGFSVDYKPGKGFVVTPSTKKKTV